MRKSIPLLLLLFLAGSWLVLFCNQPITMTNDSDGYLSDARNLFNPAYQAFRPFLYPFYLRLVGTLGLKMSVVAYLLELSSLLYFLHFCFGDWFSTRFSLVAFVYLAFTGIWSYCGTCLTESILLPAEIWMFILLVKIMFPRGRQHFVATIAYCLLTCALAILLKPWLMLWLLPVAALLFLVSWKPALILFAVTLLCFALSFRYNRSKSAETPNMIMLMVSSGNEGVLQDRLTHDHTLRADDRTLIATVLTDIGVINGTFHGNAWNASTARAVRILNVWDKDQIPTINRAFHLMYLEHPRDILRLAWLSVRRYADLSFGAACLNYTYGPELPWLRALFPWVLVAGLALFAVYAATGVRKSTRGRMATRKRAAIRQPAIVFSAIIVLVSIGFGLFLCLAGANELQRNVLPAVLFQLFALTWSQGAWSQGTRSPDARAVRQTPSARAATTPDTGGTAVIPDRLGS